jgi:hypothetical protein
MLIDTMSPEELTREILIDWDITTKSWERLSLSYDRDRRRLKVDKRSSYSKVYEIKTHKKNTWIFILSKAPAVEKYQGLRDINICSLVYYYNPTGLRVFKIMPTGGLNVYNGHFFKRYNERMSLGLTTPLEIVKHFFINNGYSTIKILPKEDREFTLSVCKEGLLLGEIQEGRSWIVNKTFITRELSSGAQDEIEEELLKHLREGIEEEITKPDFNRDSYDYKTDIIKALDN